MDVQQYLNYTTAPWGRLFYRLVWHNLEFAGKQILDFGSGFGITADKLAEKNSVVAVEPSEELLSNRKCSNTYTQLCGDKTLLNNINDNSFDIIVCHNVLEYVEARTEIINEFYRLLKPGGILSVVKHNRYGKIMQKAVFEYDIEQSLALINGKNSTSENFGLIDEYTLDELKEYCKNKFDIQNIFGVRAFYGLQSNDFKNDDKWIDKMYMLECAAENIDELKNIAFFHHVILKKI